MPGPISGETNIKLWFLDDFKSGPRHSGPTMFGAGSSRPGLFSHSYRNYKLRSCSHTLTRLWAKARQIESQIAGASVSWADELAHVLAADQRGDQLSGGFAMLYNITTKAHTCRYTCM